MATLAAKAEWALRRVVNGASLPVLASSGRVGQNGQHIEIWAIADQVAQAVASMAGLMEFRKAGLSAMQILQPSGAPVMHAIRPEIAER